LKDAGRHGRRDKCVYCIGWVPEKERIRSTPVNIYIYIQRQESRNNPKGDGYDNLDRVQLGPVGSYG
jgi:hypothetical protein